jgi:hypothetical protein
MGRTTKALGFSVPPAVVNRAQRDHDDDQWLGDLIEEAKAEQAHSPTDVEALHKESDRLASYGAQQARRLGIKVTDVNRIVHEHRKVRRG